MLLADRQASLLWLSIGSGRIEEGGVSALARVLRATWHEHGARVPRGKIEGEA